MNNYFDLKGKLHHTLFEAEQDRPQVVWVPSRQVSVLQVFVPGKSKTQWQAALPYAVEEHLAQSLEEVHLCPLMRDAEGQVTVAVVDKPTMQGWVQALEEANLEQAWLVAESFSLPWQPTPQQENAYDEPAPQWCYANSMIVEDAILVRTGAHSGLSLPQSQWTPFVTLAQKQNPGLRLEQAQAVPQSLTLSDLRAFNLRQGEFAVLKKSNPTWKTWRWPLALAALWLSLVGVQTHWQTQQTLAQVQSYQQQTEALFRQLFPDTQRVVNIQVQTQSFLNQAGSNLDALAPVQILAIVEPHLRAQKSIKPGRMDWQNQGFILNLSAENTEQLENLVDKVKQDLPTGLSARLQIQQVVSDQVEGRLHVNAN